MAKQKNDEKPNNDRQITTQKIKIEKHKLHKKLTNDIITLSLSVIGRVELIMKITIYLIDIACIVDNAPIVAILTGNETFF